MLISDLSGLGWGWGSAPEVCRFANSSLAVYPVLCEATLHFHLNANACHTLLYTNLRQGRKDSQYANQNATDGLQLEVEIEGTNFIELYCDHLNVAPDMRHGQSAVPIQV